MACCFSKIFDDPLSAVKVVVPSIAVEFILHKKVWEKASLRDLTLALALVNAYWFASTLNVSFFDTCLISKMPTIDSRQQMEINCRRFQWFNKAELVVGIVSLDLYCEWRKRILDHDGFVDIVLAQAVFVPALISAAQAAYFLPKGSLCCCNKGMIEGVSANDKKCKIHYAYVGMETIKIASLAVAGLRFGRMLTV
ncbi:hypothetical protein BX666DRAFT_1998144 [Dichotomocladium elegans]|nr:hypothetical protein BX666DRAFT_1998144 [Dichotomocladium elegans]